MNKAEFDPQHHKKTQNFLLDLVVHACNPRTWEAEAGGPNMKHVAGQF
jgi:hypothetical protein